MAEEGGVESIRIPAGAVALEGELRLPADARGLVVFAHGSGSSRHSSRNQFVARQLEAAGFGTLLFDLLTVEEDQDRERRFDIPLLADRLEAAVRWAEGGFDCSIGLFGASTGAAAAVIAATRVPVSCVISRGGRPDLAGESLRDLTSPTLFLVGGNDAQVLALNWKALDAIPATTPRLLQVVPAAGHLFEEPGALEEVARLAGEWLQLWG